MANEADLDSRSVVILQQINPGNQSIDVVNIENHPWRSKMTTSWPRAVGG